MASIDKTPDYKAILSTNNDEVMALLSTAKAVDSKGRYLPWAEFKHRYHPAKIHWAATKILRKSIAIPLPLLAANGQSFTYALPESFQGYLHTIDKLAKPLFASNSDDKTHFLAQSLVEEAISSSQLEGASTTRKMAKEMLDNERAPRDEHERMIFNNLALLKYAKETLTQPLSLELIQGLHSIAVDSTNDPYVIAGEFREADNIFVQDRDGNTAHQPPPHSEITERLSRLIEFVNTDHNQPHHFIHPAIKAIILHFMIGYEHPFVDGNGRTARALFYWFMLKQGYAPFEFISISNLLKKAPIQYGLSYLYSETDDFDLTYFIDYQLQIINRSIQAFQAYIEKKEMAYLDAQQQIAGMAKNWKLNKRQTDILSKALKNTGRAFTVKEIMNDYCISENTARGDLRHLVELKVLSEVQHGVKALFIALPQE